jgi:hypothetical protein
VPWLNPWAILGVVLALIAASGGGYLKGYRDADKSAEIAALQKEVAVHQAELLVVRAQARAAQAIAERAAERQRAAEQETADKNAEIDDYVRRLSEQPRPPGCDCSLSADDIERLRHIANPRASAPHTPSRPLDLRRHRSGAGDQEGR